MTNTRRPLRFALRSAVLLLLALSGCGDSGTVAPMDVPVPPVVRRGSYSVVGADIRRSDTTVMLAGANALHVYGGTSSDMRDWKVTLVREFIRNLKDQPVTGAAVYSRTSGAWFHPLRAIVDSNRANGMVTILCPFGWDSLLFTSLNPADQRFYGEYLARMRDIATEFKDESDVWIEVWNEPYWWAGGRGYTDDLWLADMQTMVDNIRSTGNRNIVLVPASEAGQAEAVLLNRGQALLSGRSNIVFDVHAYEKWMDGTTQASIEARLMALRQRNLAVLIGEVAPLNAGVLMDTRPMLTAAFNQRVSATAWLWKSDATDRSALRDGFGNPNDSNNFVWGTTFRDFLSKVSRTP
jgi:mannan endo-1,4-beta-mannosidase